MLERRKRSALPNGSAGDTGRVAWPDPAETGLEWPGCAGPPSTILCGVIALATFRRFMQPRLEAGASAAAVG
jgi:hypothetical protein